MKNNKRILELDALRGLAALAVVIYHYTSRHLKLFQPKFENYYEFKYGNMGVELFFILSGFVIFMSLDRVKNTFEFLYKRFLRLYPAYWICVIITFVCVKSFGLEGKEISFSHLLVNFSMLQYGLLIPSVDGVYWSLFHELMFYVLIASFLNIIKGKFLNHFMISWLLLSIINHFFHITGVSLLLNLSYAPLFTSGIYFYKLSLDRSNKFYFLMIILCYFTYSLICDAEANRLVFELIIVLGFFIIFFLYTIGKLKFLAIKPLIFLGNISYVLYLIHQNIGYIIINHLYENFSKNQILLIIPISFSIILAYFITNSIEKPFVSFLKTKLSPIIYNYNQKLIKEN